MSLIEQVIEIIQATQEAQPRIPKAYKITFFSQNDIWFWDAQLDDRICDDCYNIATGTPLIPGDQVRQYLNAYSDIIDSDTIQVNHHPGCRCYLRRETIS